MVPLRHADGRPATVKRVGFSNMKSAATARQKLFTYCLLHHTYLIVRIYVYILFDIRNIMR